MRSTDSSVMCDKGGNMKVIHEDPDIIKLDIKSFIEGHFWGSKKEVFETSGQPTPKDWNYYEIEIKIKKTR